MADKKNDPSTKKVVSTEDIEEKAVDVRTPKRRQLRAPAPSIREQSEKNAAAANQPAKRSIGERIIRFPFWLVLLPFRLLGRYVLLPVGRYLNRFKFFRIIGYILFPPYFRQALSELRLVTWPNFRETRDLVIAVLIFSIIFGLIVAGVDYVLDKVFREIILNK